MRGHQKAVARLAALAPGDCAVSTISVYELFTGVAKCRDPDHERGKVQQLLSMLSVVPFDEAAAERAADIRAGLEKVGRTCGPYDLLLAGHALTLEVPIATNNVREFSRIDGLRFEDWMT